MSYSGIRWRRHVLLGLEYCNAHYCDCVCTTGIVLEELALQHCSSMPEIKLQSWNKHASLWPYTHKRGCLEI